MKKLFLICLVLLLCATAYGIPVGARDNRVTIGAFTGPRTGAEQDDNIKASLDQLHAKMAATLAVGGSIFYVDSGTAGSAGTSWSTAVATIELANAKCTDAAGDLILVAPYHAETGSTEGVDLDKDSVTVWGLGTGIAMPTISYTTTTDTFVLGANGDNCTVHGIRFVATISAVVSAIVVEAACTDWIIEDCIFEHEHTTVDEFVDTIYVTTGSANRGIIRRNLFNGDVGANAGPKSSINFIDCDYLQIYENEFIGDIGDAHIFGETTASNFVTIRDNRIYNGYIGGALDTTPCISLYATTSGWIQNNFCVTNVATPEDAIVADDCYLSENYYSETEGTGGGSVLIGLKAGAAGTKFIVVIDVNSSLIPNGTQAAAAITGAASGALILMDISIQTAATGFAGPTSIEFTTDNVYGATGANAFIMVEAVSALGANVSWISGDATSSAMPMQIESGKKIFLHGDDGAGTGDKLQKVILYFRRVDAGATIAGLSPAPA